MVEKTIKKCALCENAKLHAIAHEKDPSNVLCLVCRKIAWFTSNAYNNHNVWERNPINANNYAIDEDEIISTDSIRPKICNMEEEIIALSSIGISVPDFGFLMPCVIADLVEGEYTNRQFAVIYYRKVDGDNEYAIVPDEDGHFASYIGFGFMTGLVETCTHGDQDKKIVVNPIKKIVIDPMKKVKQRKSCPKCE